MSKKRKREVDLELVKVYNDLADDQEDVRLKAAHVLLSKVYKPGVTSDDQTKSILTRLFRGLCSGRKSARLGFSVALTELLSQIPWSSSTPSDDTVPVSLVVDILEAETVPEGGTSGQDERDHFFGRVFGADAILKSGVLFGARDGTYFGRLIDIVCAVATKKPWLRQECGWIFYTCIASHQNNLTANLAAEIIDRLSSNKLIRTPEGVAIWLAAERRFPQAKLPKSAWKSGHPLAQKDVHILADILKDARVHQASEEGEIDIQGSARWSPSLHFAWDIVLAELLPVTSNSNRSGAESKRKGFVDKVSFDLFWKVVVDESLFAEASSAERKAWGFGLWRKLLEVAPPESLVDSFTPRAVQCLTNSFKSSDGLLQKRALRVTQLFRARLRDLPASSQRQQLARASLKALLESVSYGDFDQITKTKTLQNLVEIDSTSLQRSIFEALAELLEKSPAGEDESKTSLRQRTILNLQSKLASARLQNCSQQEHSADTDVDFLILDVFKYWAREVCVASDSKFAGENNSFRSPVLLPRMRELAKERLALGFEQALKLGKRGGLLLTRAVLQIAALEDAGVQMAASFEDQIREDIRVAWQRLRDLDQRANNASFTTTPTATPPRKSSQAENMSFSEGIALLYSLLLFQIYVGETEAIQVLQECLEYHGRSQKQKKGKILSEETQSSADSIIEILLSFAARPSKLLKRITVQIFDAFAPHITTNGLEALCRILETRENLQGQQEMFQAEDVDVVDDGSNVDEMDSDVEVVSTSSVPDSSDVDTDSEGDSSTPTSDDESDDDADEDEELAAFDAALAAALGTRRLDQSDVAAAATSGSSDDSSSDVDMGDDDMMELDSKLVEVFRARNEEQSKNRKKEAKEAKENIVHFKNRVLDLLESYVKHQPTNPLILDLIVPLLKLARMTQTKQLADRACNTLQQAFSRNKGVNVPELSTDAHNLHAVAILRSIHEEAGMEASNAHSHAASQSSILVVKALVNASPGHVMTVVEIYGTSRVRQLTDKKYRIVPGFFTDWNNWCQTSRDKLAK